MKQTTKNIRSFEVALQIINAQKNEFNKEKFSCSNLSRYNQLERILRMVMKFMEDTHIACYNNFGNGLGLTFHEDFTFQAWKASEMHQELLEYGVEVETKYIKFIKYQF